MSSRPKTATQIKRESYPYREKYFQQNPGIFGCIWICSQCYKPIFGKHNVVIDHIVPLAKGGRNHVSNCTACCRECNAKKSDKVDYRVAKGKIFKILESNAFRAQRGAGAFALLGITSAAALSRLAMVGTGSVATGAGGIAVHGMAKMLKFTLTKAVPGVIKAVATPLVKGSMLSRFFFLVLYALIVAFVLKDNTALFDAWK